MKKNEMYSYIAASLAILIPVQGRFGYGLIIVIALNLFLLFGILIRRFLTKIKLDDFQSVITGIFLVSAAVLFKQFLILYSPVNALILGFSIYMTAAATYLTSFLYGKSEMTLRDEVIFNMRKSKNYSIFALLFFLFRDIFGYGTITFPVFSGLKSIVLVKSKGNFSFGTFWASIPGAVFLFAIMIAIFAIINNRLKIVAESEENNSKEQESEEKKNDQ